MVLDDSADDAVGTGAVDSVGNGIGDGGAGASVGAVLSERGGTTAAVVVGHVEFPTRQDQIWIVEGAAAAHVVAGVLRPDLGPLRPRVVLVLGDAPQRVALHDDVHVVTLPDVERRGGRGRGQPQHPARLDVGRVRESLPVRHRCVEVQIEDLVGDVQRALLVVIREVGRDREHRVAALHRVRRDRRGRRNRRRRDILRNPIRSTRRLVEGSSIVDHERGTGGCRRRSANRGLGQAGPHRRHRHHDEQTDGDEPGDPLGPAEPTHRRHRHPAVADLVDDLDDRVDHDHRDGDPHDAQAGPQQQVDDGVVAQRIAKGVADRARVPRLHPAQRIGRPEPRRRHADEQVRHTDGDGQERDRRHSEAAGGSLVPLVHGRLPSPRLHTRAWGADQAKRKSDAGVTAHAPSGRFPDP